MRVLFILFIMFSFIFSASQCSAQVSDLQIEVDPFQHENDVFKEWSSDMKKLDITTEDRGLIYGITVTNTADEPVTVDSLTIQVRVERMGEFNTFFKQVSTYIFLPPNEKKVIYIPVDFGHKSNILGTYTAEIQRIEGAFSEYTLEAYPSEFRLLSEEQFQKELEEKKDNPSLIDFPEEVHIHITLFAIGSISLTGLVVYLLKRNK